MKASSTATPIAPASTLRLGGGAARLDAAAVPERWMALSVLVALLTMALKVVAWRLTGSVGMLSDALESCINLVAAVFGFAMLRVARTPPDLEHPFGHQKAEYFASILEGLLVLGAGVAIVWAALGRFTHPSPLEHIDIGVLVSMLAGVLNALTAWLLLRAGRRHQSIALRADAHHLMSDVWTTVAVIAGVLGVMASGWLWLDPLAALLVAALVLYHALRIVADSVSGLMDSSVSTPEYRTMLAAVKQVLMSDYASVELQQLRTRVSGRHRFLDLRLAAPPESTLAQTFACRNALIERLEQTGDHIEVSVEFVPKVEEQA